MIHDSCFLIYFTLFKLIYLGSWVQIKNSWLDVKLCKEGTQGCDVSNDTTSVGGVLKFPKHSNEETVSDSISLYLLSYLSI